jgi:hypothetical protein
MTSNKIPSVLQRPHGNSLSTERLLKQVIGLLEKYGPVDERWDEVQACIDSLKSMLAAIDRD